jgi:hypothetical protein
MREPNPKSEIRNPKSSRRLRPPQFGLRTLLWAVTAIGMVLALGQWLPPITVACIVLLALSILAHIAGNAIGTRLREIGDLPENRDETGPSSKRQPGRPQASDFAPATHLGRRTQLGWPIVIGSVAGVLLGGIGGGLWTLMASRGPVGPLNVGVGVVAFGVLGGIGAFLIFGFVQVGVAAIRQALRHSQPPRSR